MTTMNISLPDTMKQFIDTQVTEGGYSTSSEYVRDLVRADQKQKARLELANLLKEGIASGSSKPVDNAFWDRKRKELTAAKGRK